MMATMFSPAWQRYFEGAAAPTPAQQPRAGAASPTPPAGTEAGATRHSPPPPAGTEAGATGARATATGGAAPPDRPNPPVGLKNNPSEPTRHKREFAWATWQLPARLRDDVILNLRQTLRWRTQHCPPLPPPECPVERRRFGLLGEQLAPLGAITVRKALRAELRETIRTLEEQQPVLVRNSWLAMHSVRLGQLCHELEQRGLDALEEIRCGLVYLWD